jgi:hypothetical protein
MVPTATILLDRSKKNKIGQHPIRIQVYHAGKQDKYATKLYATAVQFASPNRQLQKQLYAAQIKADAVCGRLGGTYTREKFKRMY